MSQSVAKGAAYSSPSSGYSKNGRDAGRPRGARGKPIGPMGRPRLRPRSLRWHRPGPAWEAQA